MKICQQDISAHMQVSNNLYHCESRLHHKG
jgi:hypothetical protein